MADKPSLTPTQRRRLYRAAYPIVRAPYGGMSINRKDYTAGQFLPGRQAYGQESVSSVAGDTRPLPPPLDHDHLKTLDLHQVEPTWKKQGKDGRNSYGGVIFNDHGQVLLVEPSEHFLGYAWTFPKGGINPGEHPADAGLREVKEESGHDASILGLVPKRFPNSTGHSHYFLMRSHGQTSQPDWETQDVRWATPEQAHHMIDQTTYPRGKERDHAILAAALTHLKLLQSNPEINAHLRPTVQRQVYSRSSCDHTCSCTKCATITALNRIVYSQRYRHSRVRRILYESRNQTNTFDSSGVYGDWTPRWRPQVTPAEFIVARNNTKYPGFLSPLAEDEIKNHKLILSHDNTVGAALSPEGDIQNVFNNNGPKKAGFEAVLEAMRRGGYTLDAFDHFLPGLYSQLGFRETGRVKFNREYAPPGWNYQTFGEPDVVFMKRNQHEPINEAELRRRVHDRSAWQPHTVAGQYFDDWDRAKAHSRGAGIPGQHDPGAGEGVGGSELGSTDRERPSGGVPLNLAVQGHTQSLDLRSPLRAVATGVINPVTRAYQDMLKRVRSRSQE